MSADYRRFLSRMVDTYLDAVDFTDSSLWGDDAHSFAPEVFKQAEEDCAGFLAYLEEQGVDAYAYSPEALGHDFWLTRNRHGAGFWDGGWPEPAGRILTDAAHTFGTVDTYSTDDGLIHFA